MRHSNLFIAVVGLASLGLLAFFGTAALSPIESRDDARYSGRVIVPLKRPSISFGNPSIGPRDAKVTIFSFGDYQCPPCAAMNDTLAQLSGEFASDVRVVWKDMPDEAVHSLAVPAANAARCAGDQGAFWPYHALLMAQQGQIITNNFPVFAAQSGVADLASFNACVAAQRNVPLVERDVVEGQRLGITATPTLFIGERRIEGAVDADQLRGIITAEVAKAKAAPAP